MDRTLFAAITELRCDERQATILAPAIESLP
jgi:hypothetical protein